MVHLNHLLDENQMENNSRVCKANNLGASNLRALFKEYRLQMTCYYPYNKAK